MLRTKQNRISILKFFAECYYVGNTFLFALNSRIYKVVLASVISTSMFSSSISCLMHKDNTMVKNINFTIYLCNSNIYIYSTNVLLGMERISVMRMAQYIADKIAEVDSDIMTLMTKAQLYQLDNKNISTEELVQELKNMQKKLKDVIRDLTG